MTIKNHTNVIEKALHLDTNSCKHEGNYQFKRDAERTQDADKRRADTGAKTRLSP